VIDAHLLTLKTNKQKQLFLNAKNTGILLASHAMPFQSFSLQTSYMQLIAFYVI